MARVLIVGLVLVGALVGITALVIHRQPEDYLVSRSIVVTAPPARAFDLVNDFHAWESWSPWAKLDPNAKVTFEGPSSGVGAIFKWKGNDDVGEGRMCILESERPSKVAYQLEFVLPMEGHCLAEFTFTPKADQTQIVWTMTGKKNFVSKAFCMLCDMDAMIGKDFEKGLVNLKSVVEAESAETRVQAE